MSHILTSVKYKEHLWLLRGDMKVIMLLLGLQGGFANISVVYLMTLSVAQTV
jgi:hypothetical protein